MADSTITKRALAASLKKLMLTQPFNKISISNICDMCLMNRKSFYYHFKDKEDLLNWIFDTEFSEICHTNVEDGLWDELVALTGYLYENKSFYRKAFRIDGQNSPTVHLHEILFPIIRDRLRLLIENDEVTDFQVNFFADGIICAIKRWISAPDCLSPEEFMRQIHSCMDGVAEEFLKEKS